MNSMKTAVLGLNNSGQLLLKAASKIDHFQIQAVADKDAKLTEKFSNKYNCAAYDDYRQLIIQNQFDCLLVAASMHSCIEHIKMAIKKKFNILKLAPIARHFEEAAELVRLAEDENVKFAIANPSRFAPGFLAFRQFLQQGRVEKPFLITAECSVGKQMNPAWQTDPKLAGGGVLLHNCYQIIDQIMWHFPIPQQVYSLQTNTATGKKGRLYLTENTAVVTMKFTDTFFANLIANKAVGQKKEVAKLYSKDYILTVENNLFTVKDHLGQFINQAKYHTDELIWMTKSLKNFALSITTPDKNKLCSSARENLKNMAVIESAYLSARTAMPEEPNKILKMIQLEPTSI